MPRVAMLVVALSCFPMLTACDTSCGKRGDPILWSDGVRTADATGRRSYQTTPITSTWLHFPSYRRFRLPHGLGTKNLDVVTYVSLAEDNPVSDDGAATRFEVSSAGEVLVSVEDEDHITVENSTCENTYYLFARITEAPTSGADASIP